MRRAPMILALLILPAAAPAADRAGELRIVDADTVEVAGARIRLHGVDAPERGQDCTDAAGAAWPCGAWVTAEARARWDGKVATCAHLDVDRYGRDVSRCRVGAEDLGAALVRGGLAMAYRDYSTDHVADEAFAQGARVGIWRGQVEAPAVWRARQRAVAAGEAPPGDCAVKGNVSGRGRIYHVPGAPSYAATRIDAGAGERWFCTAAEAEAAGWRAPGL